MIRTWQILHTLTRVFFIPSTNFHWFSFFFFFFSSNNVRAPTKYARIYTGFVSKPNFPRTSRHYRIAGRVVGGAGEANLCRWKCFIRTNSSVDHGILLDTNDPWIPRIWMGHGSQGFRQASGIIRSSILLLAYRCPISKLLSRCTFCVVSRWSTTV